MKIEDLNLYALKYFFDLVETKSFTKAAEKNFVTRSAVSQSIQRLEKWSGKKLTTHERKIFQLTPAGESFYRQMKSSYSKFAQSITTPTDRTRGVKIGCSRSLAEPYLFPMLKKLGPLDFLNVTPGSSRHLSHSLQTEEIHLSLFIPEESDLDKSDDLVHRGHFVLASRDGKPRSRIITTEPRAEVYALQRYYVNRKNETPVFFTVESWSLALSAALEMDCACLIPDFLIGPFKKVLTRGYDPSYFIVLESLSHEKLTEAEIELKTLFKKEFRLTSRS